ncbi:Protein lingerer like [Fagus crenata]
MATCCKEKAVLVTVYVERPKKRKVSTNHHHHYLHRTTKQEVTQFSPCASGKGYDRRAQLLQYSQHLRESSRSATITPLPLKSSSSINKQPTTQITAVQRKQKDDRAPACLGSWKISIQNFFRSLTSIQAKKERKKKKHRG